MSLPIESEGFKDLIVVLGAAGLVIPAFTALRISPVVGFILVGVAVGPHALGAVPALNALTISNAEVLAPAAEIGIAMLLFALGLELSVERLKTLRKLIFGLGTMQMLGCTAALSLLIWPFGLGIAATLALGFALALSSTAVGLQMLSSSGRIGSQAGRTAFAMFLFQDIAIAPVLLLLGAGSAVTGFGGALATGLLAIGGIVLAGKLLLRPLFLQAARTRRPELFLAASLVVLIGSAAVAAVAGLSPAVGALLAGVMLADTEYRRQIEATVAPFEGLLLGVFLIWVGMRLDLAAIAESPLLVLGGVAAVVAVKALVVGAMLRLTGRATSVSMNVAALLASPSETSLVVLGAVTAGGLIAGPTADFALLITGLGLAIAPLLGLAGQALERRYSAAPPISDAPVIPTVPGRTVIIGFGRVGRIVASMLEAHGKPYIAVDSDPDSVARLRRAGKPVVYGDARRPELLDGLALGTAGAVVLTVDGSTGLDTLVRVIRERHPDLCLVARARDADHASHLYRLGVTDAVPETVESSLQLAEALLVDLGVPMGPVIASIHEKRAELRAAIQGGAPGMVREPRLWRRRLRDLKEPQPGSTAEV